MKQRNKLNFALFVALLASLGATTLAFGQEPSVAKTKKPIPGQFAQDFVAGRVPSEEEVAAAEKDVAADPNNFELVRRLGKGYFFQFFGEGNNASVAKAQKTFDRVLELKQDDPETLAYYGALWTLVGQRLDKKDPAKQKADYDKGFALLQKAEKLAPRHGAVISVTTASYLDLPESYGMASHVVATLEGMRKAMGPMFDRFSHHGRQRLLLTLGRAYALTGQADKARVNFDEALKINQESVEAALLKAELHKLAAKH
jgi:tetratricopeptide (TPR) repeat protein